MRNLLIFRSIALLAVIGALVSGCALPPDFDFEYNSAETQFTGKITGYNLGPKGYYMLCINGKIGQAGNDILWKHYERLGGEGYYNFKKVKTDAKGSFEEEFSVELPEGEYDVTFLVKDMQTKNWDCIFIEDHVQFTVSRP